MKSQGALQQAENEKIKNGPKKGDIEGTEAVGYCGSPYVEPGGGDVAFREDDEDATYFKDEFGRPGVVITNKSQTQDGVLCSISISDTGMANSKILRLFAAGRLSL